MVDSMVDWPLHQVVDYLKKRDKDGKSGAQDIRMYCRSTVKSLVEAVDWSAKSYGTSRNQMCRWLSYHGIAFAREDPTISEMVRVQALLRDVCLPEDDTDTLDMMKSMIPYSPRVVDENEVHIHLYDSWVSSEFEETSRVCGVYKYRVVQVFLIKSLLTDDADKLGAVAERLRSELSRWDKWMAFRLAALEGLVRQKGKSGIRTSG